MKSEGDFQVFRESLVAAARGPFFPDWEFSTLFGLDRSEVDTIAEAFSPVTPITGDVALALNNAMNNLLGYPHHQDVVWPQWLSVPPSELEAVFGRWQASRGEG